MCNSLLGVVELERKVLPRRLIRGRREQLLVGLVEDLEGVLVDAGVGEEGAVLELDLVAGEVGALMPDVLGKKVSGPIFETLGVERRDLQGTRV